MPVKTNIENIIDVKKPLTGDFGKDAAEIRYDGSCLIYINEYPDKAACYQLFIRREFKLLSPLIYVKENGLEKTGADGIFTDSIVLQFEKFLIVMKTGLSKDVLLRQNANTNEFTITCDNEDIRLEIYHFKELSKYIKQKNRYKTVTGNTAVDGIGLSIDLADLISPELDYAKLKKFFNNIPLYFLIRNLENNGFGDLDGFLEKMNVNNIGYILQSGFPDIDSGKGQIVERIERFISLNAKGMHISIDELRCDNNTTGQILKKSAEELGLIISGYADRIFFLSHIPLQSPNSCYIFEIPRYEESIYEKIEQLFIQSYPDVFIHFGTGIVDNISPGDMDKMLMPVLLASGFIMNYNLLYHLVRNKKLRKAVERIVELRRSLKIYLEGILDAYRREGKIPMRTVFFENKLKGLELGDELYVSFISGNKLHSVFYLSDDTPYYSVSSGRILGKKGFYAFNGGNENFLLLQKAETIVMIIPETFPYLDMPQKMKFIIYVSDNLTKTINEKTNTGIIGHRINVRFLKNRVAINYSSESAENLSRFIVFHFVSGQGNAKIICNEKRIIPEQSSGNHIEFGILNKTNKLEISLMP